MSASTSAAAISTPSASTTAAPTSSSPSTSPSSTSFPLPPSSQNPARSPRRSVRPSASSVSLSDDSGSDNEEGDDSIWWSASEIREILDRSTQLKLRGNATFGRGAWSDALEVYKEALLELPVRTRSLRSKRASMDPIDIATERKEGKRKAAEDEAEHDEQDVKEMNEINELRAVLFGNVAASLMKLERWKDAVVACDDALEDNPGYVKALHRRAMSNEAIGSWSSLSSALEDYTTLSKMDALSASDLKSVTAAMIRVPPLLAVQQEREKNEVLGKLKDLGNGVLGKFGLSLDNFKLSDNGSGGYSMNFGQ